MSPRVHRGRPFVESARNGGQPRGDLDDGDPGPEDPCGNDTLDDGEACDAGNIPTDCVTLGYSGGTLGCDFACALDETACVEPGCGNGFLDEDEDCDDGECAAAGCDANCALEDHYECSGEPSTCTPVCGDAVTLVVDEECDLGECNGTGDYCCSSTCERVAGCEIEPNNDDANANSFVTLRAGDVAKGRIDSGPTDEDVWMVEAGPFGCAAP